MNKKVIIIIVVVIVVIGGGVFIATNKKDKDNTSSATSGSNSSQASNDNSSSSASTDTADQSGMATITYSDSGFSPTTLTVKSGTKLTVKNTSSGVLQFDSNPHPEHTEDPELNVGRIDPGESKTITVTATGSHGYHNHLNSSDTGTLVVQ